MDHSSAICLTMMMMMKMMKMIMVMMMMMIMMMMVVGGSCTTWWLARIAPRDEGALSALCSRISTSRRRSTICSPHDRHGDDDDNGDGDGDGDRFLHEKWFYIVELSTK